jgi:hypothetical protein
MSYRYFLFLVIYIFFGKVSAMPMLGNKRLGCCCCCCAMPISCHNQPHTWFWWSQCCLICRELPGYLLLLLDLVLFEFGKLMFGLLLVLINMTLLALLSCHVLEVHFGLHGCRYLLPIQTSLVILFKFWLTITENYWSCSTIFRQAKVLMCCLPRT